MLSALPRTPSSQTPREIQGPGRWKTTRSNPILSPGTQRTGPLNCRMNAEPVQRADEAGISAYGFKHAGVAHRLLERNREDSTELPVAFEDAV